MTGRLLILICFLSFSFILSQKKLEGNYNNQLGEILQLHPDGTFEYKFRFDLASSWNLGRWKIVDKKYLLLTVIEVKDKIIGEEKFVISHDKISDSTTMQNYAILSLQGGGQSRSLPPNKFLIKDEILYPYSKSGKIEDKKKQSPVN